MPEPSRLPARAAIREITIKGFRGIEHRELSFIGPHDRANDFVVLAGPNGSGKTTVLEACLIVAQHGHLLDDLSSRGSNPDHDGDYRITAILETADLQMRSEYAPGRHSHRKEVMGRTALTDPFDAPCAYFSSWRAPLLVGPLPITAGKRGRRPAEREVNRLRIVKQYLINARAHEALGGASSGTNGTPGGVSRYQALIRVLNDAWEKFHPGACQQFAVQAVTDEPDAGFDVFLVRSDGKRVPLDALSSGELELFNFVAWMLITKFDGGIICIDEPELHLDPQWHVLMMQLLRRLQPNAQFIVATHSPAIYDAAYSFQRHFLVSPGDPRARAWHLSDAQVAAS